MPIRIIALIATGFSLSACAQPSLARWVPNPERGEPDSTLSGGRR